MNYMKLTTDNRICNMIGIKNSTDLVIDIGVCGFLTKFE